MTQRYATAQAFRTALEERLKRQARAEGSDLTRLRRQVSFQRLLARLFALPGSGWLLKGGHALELRMPGRARATKDVDLAVPFPVAQWLGDAPFVPSILDLLQDAAEIDLEDWFEFRIGSPTANLDAPPDGGARFRVDVRLGGKPFGTFSIDVGLGDVVVSPPEWITGPDLLAFAGIPPARVAVLPLDQTFAEKIHVYTLPRDAANSRVKDLIDLVLLVQRGLPPPEEIRVAVRATFDRRGTHEIPADLPRPPSGWAPPFAAMTGEYGISLSLASAYEVVSRFWHGLDWEGL